MADLVKTDATFDNEFMSFYSQLPKKENNFILFNHNSFYSLHDKDAEYVSKNFLNTTESLKTIEKNGQQMNFTWISLARFPSLIRHLLIENNFSVEIYQKTNPKSPNNKQWKLECEASPECLDSFEDILYAENINISINLCAVYLTNDNMVYVASIDPVSCVIYLGSFQDNDGFRHLESIFVRSNPKQCFIPENCKKLDSLLKRNRITSRSYFHGQIDFLEITEILHNLSLPQCRPIVDFILKECGNNILIPLKQLLLKQKLISNKMSKNVTLTRYFIRQLNSQKFVRLDLSSMEHLHLFPKARDSKMKHSLFQILNQCKTISGTKLLENFIRHPLVEQNQIESRLDIVDFFVGNSQISLKIREQILPRIPDISKLYKKLNSERFNIKDVFNLYILLEQVRNLLLYFDQQNIKYSSSMKHMIINKLTKSVAQTNELYKNLATSLDLDLFTSTGEMCLNVKKFPDLFELDMEIKKLIDKTRKEHSNILHKYQADIHLEKDKDIGWIFRASKKFNLSLDKCCIILSKDKDLKFITLSLEKINHKYLELKKQFDKTCQNCLKLLISQCAEKLYGICLLESTISLLDVLLTFAKVANDSRTSYTRPNILGKGTDRIELIKFRHPILEMFKNGQFVANNILFDKNCKFFIITGPNMGGKSTFLRSVALCILMAQIGSFVPCQSASISLVDAIYTRFSSSDDPSMGLSTFMAEMNESASILKSTTSDSLILIDELGRSTATNDGFGLAQAITQYISTQINAFTLFATHFHNLGSNLPNVGKLHMESSFNNNQLIIHYLAKPDSNWQHAQSFGIEVMKCINMPKYLIEDAKRRLDIMDNCSIDSHTFNKALMIGSSKDASTNVQEFIQDIYHLF